MLELEIEVIARALIRKDDRVLFCKSIKGNYLYLPGGHVEFGETAVAAVARELVEETGQSSSVGSLALVHEHLFRQGPHLHHELNLVFHVELDSDEVQSHEKKIAFEWVATSDLGGKDLRPAMLYQWLRNPPRPGGAPHWLSEPMD